MDEKYRLVLRGEVMEGQHRAVVKRRLMEALSLSEPQLDKLFSGDAVVLKKSADARTAARYQGLFKKAGGRLRVLPTVELDAEEELGESAPHRTGAPASPAAATGPAQSSPAHPEPGPDAAAAGTTFTLLPADYQPPPAVVAPEIKAPDFVVAEVGVDLVEPAPSPPVVIPEAPFEVAELGAYLLDEPGDQPPAELPEVDFELAEVGADIGLPSEDEVPAPPDISHLELSEI